MMNPIPTSTPARRRHERGMALLAAMFCVFVVALAAGAVAIVLDQEVRMNRTITAQTAAKAVAAGGVEHVLAFCAKWCADNPEGTLAASTVNGSSACSGTIGAGSYSVTVNDKGSNVLELICVGTVTGVSAGSRAYVALPVNSLPALGYGLFANGSIGSNGNGSYTVGANNPGFSVFARKGLTIKGKGYYGGTAGTVAGQELDVTIKQGSKTYLSDITMPVIDSAYYLDTATDNGQVFTDFPAAARTSAGYTPPGGVLWINSSTQYSFQGSNGTLRVNGVLVMHGGAGISFKGNGNFQVGTASTTVQPALIMLGGGSIDLGGNSGTETVNGAIYTDSGDVTFSGAAGAMANVISGGNVSFSGGGNGDFVSAWGPVDPTHFIVDTRIRLLCWER